jgi:hypothetical protein
MTNKPPFTVLTGAGSDVQTRSIGGGVERRLLRMTRRRHPARLHVVPNIPLTLAARHAQADARSAAASAAKSSPSDVPVATGSKSPRLHVVVCKGAAGVFTSKSST